MAVNMDSFWRAIDTIREDVDRRDVLKTEGLLSTMSESKVRDFVDSLNAARRALDPVELFEPDYGLVLEGDSRDAAVIGIIVQGKAVFDDACASTRIQTRFDEEGSEWSESFLEVVGSTFEDKTGEAFGGAVDHPAGDLTVYVSNADGAASPEVVRGGESACAAIAADPELGRLLQRPGSPNSFFMYVRFVSEEEYSRIVRSGGEIEATASVLVPQNGTFEEGWRAVKAVYEKAAAKFGLPRVEALS